MPLHFYFLIEKNLYGYYGFLVGLAMGYLSEVSYYLSLSRMIAFYPFFC
ncbi:hypothetical protein SAMN02745150_00333 [Brevinema andersonii]|uniref:Uncharacterized protein n=1 Tax=Brevinema andersonii TaxID=34097 RepID=A0A1I1DBL0_BREAD|nr:hypothetical protein SAMN02745150_00333 [Brevinema andersonii]